LPTLRKGSVQSYTEVFCIWDKRECLSWYCASSSGLASYGGGWK